MRGRASRARRDELRQIQCPGPIRCDVAYVTHILFVVIARNTISSPQGPEYKLSYGWCFSITIGIIAICRALSVAEGTLAQRDWEHRQSSSANRCGNLRRRHIADHLPDDEAPAV